MKTKTSRTAGGQACKPSSPQAGKLASRQFSILSKPVIHVLLISILGVLIYSNTFHSPFQWDETDFIVGNPIIRDLAYFQGPSRAAELPVYDGLRSRYIGYFTFALNYKLHGFDVTGYHIVNLVIHIINAILVYFFILLTFRSPYFSNQRAEEESRQYAVNSKQPSHYSMPLTPYPLLLTPYSHLFAFAVALLFVAHPVQTESVTYIFQRFASLVSMFYLLSVVLYIKGRLIQEAIGNRLWVMGHKQEVSTPITYRLSPVTYFFLSLISAVLAMKTKENAFTLPVVIILYESLFFTGPLKSRALRLLPFLLTMLIIPVTMLGTGIAAGDLISEVREPDFIVSRNMSGMDYLFTQFRVVVTYIRLLLLPINQNLSYSYPIYHSLFDPPVFLSFLFLAALLGMAVYLIYIERKSGSASSLPLSTYPLILNPYRRLIAFGIFWFFIALSVESSVIPIPMVIDEYRIYLPSVGFFIAAMAGSLVLIQRYTKRSKQYAESSMHPTAFCLLPTIIFTMIILALSSATFARNTLWKDKVTLWEDVVRKSPGSPRANNNLGLAYADKGDHEKAIELYKKCISLNPSYVLAYTNLGVSYAAIGKPGMAIENFEKAIALDPKYSVAYSNLARAYGDTGRYDKAVENYAMAVSLTPYDSRAYHGLGTAYTLTGRLDEALTAYSTFVALSPDDPEAYRSRGVIYANKGDFRNAGADFQKACSLGSKESCEYLKDPRFR